MTDKTFVYVEKFVDTSLPQEQISNNISQAGQNWSIVAVDTDVDPAVDPNMWPYIPDKQDLIAVKHWAP